MTFDIKKIPFSRYGSYFAISQENEEDKLYIRDLHGGDEAPSNLYEVVFPGRAVTDFDIAASETILRFISKEDTNRVIEIVLGKENTLHIKLTGIAMELKAVGGKYDTLTSYGVNQWEHILYTKERRILFTLLSGQASSHGTWRLIGTQDAGMLLNEEENHAYVVMENYRTVWKAKEYETLETVHKEVTLEYEQWKKSMPGIKGIYEAERDLACYLTWANFVHKEGFLTEDVMYSSKNWMYNFWSWDNCLCSLPLSYEHPELSYAQLKVFFGVQDESGCYPDYINDKFASFSCCKPPIHAWTFWKLRQSNAYFNDIRIIEEAYSSFRKVIDYWMNYRLKRNGALPEYNHGNDSGWDNASVFCKGVPVEAPDLSAYIIRQMDILSEMAQELGREKESKEWKEKADELYQKLLFRLYNHKNFYAIHVPTGKPIKEGDSLLLYLPIVIGYRFSKEMLQQLVWDLENRFETTYGLSTESPNSPCYRTGGYWLGPIWAPVTYILIDALRENGYPDFARRLAMKFCKLTSIGQMAENYDPMTGVGYDDPAFSWTACVFLQLLQEYPDMEEA